MQRGQCKPIDAFGCEANTVIICPERHRPANAMFEMFRPIWNAEFNHEIRIRKPNRFMIEEFWSS